MSDTDGDLTVDAQLPPSDNADIFLVDDLSNEWKAIIDQLSINSEFSIIRFDSDDYYINDNAVSLTDNDCATFQPIIDETMTFVPLDSKLVRYTFKFRII